MSTRSEERGAALVVSLMLAAALSILAIAGISDVTAELAMTRNLALERGAFAAAASGIELALGSAPFEVGRDTEVTLELGADREFVVSAVTRFVGLTEVPDHGFSMGASRAGIVAHHFEIHAIATGPRGAQSIQHQGFYVLGPTVAELP